MAGGKRPGAGRPKGARNSKTVETIAKAEQSGLMPLDYMLSVLRDESAPPQDRMDAAKAAAPFVHHKLATIEHTGADGGPLQQDHQITVRFVKPERQD